MPVFPCPHCRHEVESLEDEPARQCPHCRGSLLVQNRYLLVDVLGVGNAGAVYLGEDEARNRRKLAVKTLKLSTDLDWQASDSFMRGARALMTLEHEGLPRVFDADEDDHRVVFLVREVLDGGTLAERVEEGSVGPSHVPGMLDSLLDVLHLVHTQTPPVLHRDIKPSNIMFRGEEDTQPILVDFDRTESAMAQRTGIDPAAQRHWTAPELGNAKPNASHDLYGLGLTLLFVATGGKDPDELPHDEDGEFDVAAALPEVDEKVRSVISRMVAHLPGDRFKSAAEAKKALTGESLPVSEKDASGEDEPSPSNPLFEPIPERSSQTGGDIVAVIVVMLIAAAIAGLVAFVSRGFG